MRGQKVSEDLCVAITRMLPVLNVFEIEAYTGVSKKKIQEIRACYHRTGKAFRPRKTQRLGRHRHLSMENIQYIQACLARNCDTYLDEIQTGLDKTCGVKISLASIWRAMHRSGYTLKKVSSIPWTLSTVLIPVLDDSCRH